MKKTYRVTMRETQVVYLDYLVEAESEEEAKEDYAGWPCVDEEPSDLENNIEFYSIEEVENAQ